MIRGDPPLTVQWRKDSVQIDSAFGAPRIATRPEVGAGGWLVSELTLINAASADEGLYECGASNVYGEDRDVVFVQVQDVPQPPQDVRVTSVGSRSVQLEWMAPSSDGGNAVKEYVVHYKAAAAAAGLDEDRQEMRVETAYGTLNNLLPATSYQIYVTASNSLGQSQPGGAGLTVTTQEEAPQGPPLDVSASLVTSRGFTLTWSPPSLRLQNGLILSYLVTMDSPNRTINRTVVPSSSSSSSAEAVQYRLTGLRPNTNHVVYVQAVNGQGSGPASPSLTVRTAEDVPDEGPLNVACVSLSPQSLQITWQPPRPDHRNGLIRGYKVFYEPAEDSENVLALLDHHQEAAAGQQQTTSELTLFLSSLAKFSDYRVQVLAFTSAGDGVRSSPLTCTTQEDVPDTPGRVRVVQSGPDSLSVVWLPNPRPAGRVSHYNVYGREVERGQEGNPQKWTVSGAQAGRLEVRNLRPRRTVFYFQVAAVSSVAGEGPRSPTVPFTFIPTNKNLPAAVVICPSVFHFSVFNKSARLSGLHWSGLPGAALVPSHPAVRSAGRCSAPAGLVPRRPPAQRMAQRRAG